MGIWKTHIQPFYNSGERDNEYWNGEHANVTTKWGGACDHNEVTGQH